MYDLDLYFKENEKRILGLLSKFKLLGELKYSHESDTLYITLACYLIDLGKPASDFLLFYTKAFFNPNRGSFSKIFHLMNVLYFNIGIKSNTSDSMIHLMSNFKDLNEVSYIPQDKDSNSYCIDVFTSNNIHIDSPIRNLKITSAMTSVKSICAGCDFRENVVDLRGTNYLNMQDCFEGVTLDLVKFSGFEMVDCRYAFNNSRIKELDLSGLPSKCYITFGSAVAFKLEKLDILIVRRDLNPDVRAHLCRVADVCHGEVVFV